jgi:hypothetical protein
MTFSDVLSDTRRSVKVETIRRKVAAIERMADDPEGQHLLEDTLYISVLRTIARGAPDPQELAREALEASKLEHVRWYA